ncbi:hypothetical protein [Blastococcus sp. SYSU DS0973]
MPLELPAEFESALQQLAAALRLPQDCVDGVTRSLELVVGGLVVLPAELEELAGQLPGALEGPPEPVAHPVVYPGYAPTGAEDDGTDLLPAALGSALALAGAGAGAAAYRRQWRAADPRR